MAGFSVVTSDDELRRFCAVPGLSPLTPEMVGRHRPDASFISTETEAGERYSLWWTNTPTHDDHRLGFIGHLAASQAGMLPSLLNRACDELKRRGCTMAVAPIDGNTWNRYRLLTERGDEPLFFLEPDNPEDWQKRFIEAGFQSMATFTSAVNEDLTRLDPGTAELTERLAKQNIRLRNLEMSRFDEELRAIYRVSVAGFAANFLYSPIEEGDFVEQYRPIQTHVLPELVLFAETANRAIGFAFAIPDLLEAKRGKKVESAILKSMAVHPDFAGLGLGRLLMNRCHETAHRLGFHRVIHALMHEDNRSRRMSEHTAKVIRRYALFSREL